MTAFEIKREIEDIRFHMETLRATCMSIKDPFVQIMYRTEIRACLANLKMLKEALCDSLLMELKNMYPKADAIYEDKIVSLIGEDGLHYLIGKQKIQLCGCINGRFLYAL